MPAILKKAFSSLAVEINKRFSSLGALLKAKKPRKTNDCIVLSKDNSGILNKFKKELNFSKQDGAEIHGHLATIVQKLLKDKPKEDKLNEIKKWYLRPNNCAMLAETRLTYVNWNNLSDCKLQKVHQLLGVQLQWPRL